MAVTCDSLPACKSRQMVANARLRKRTVACWRPTPPPMPAHPGTCPRLAQGREHLAHRHHRGEGRHEAEADRREKAELFLEHDSGEQPAEQPSWGRASRTPRATGAGGFSGTPRTTGSGCVSVARPPTTRDDSFTSSVMSLGSRQQQQTQGTRTACPSRTHHGLVERSPDGCRPALGARRFAPPERLATSGAVHRSTIPARTLCGAIGRAHAARLSLPPHRGHGLQADRRVDTLSRCGLPVRRRASARGSCWSTTPPTFARCTSSALEHEGYEVESASDGEEALALAHGWRPNLIVTDIFMPGMGGFELITRVRSDSAPPVPGIVRSRGSATPRKRPCSAGPSASP